MYSVSETGEWLSYKIVRGEYGIDMNEADLQDVMILRVNPDVPQIPIQITQRSGAGSTEPVWSPDGRQLAFTDVDAIGIPQIYSFDVDRQQSIQLTEFEPAIAGKLRVLELSWSPDGRNLAFSVVLLEETSEGLVLYSGEVGIVNMIEGNVQMISLQSLGEAVEVKYPIWWSNDGEELFFAGQQEGKGFESPNSVVIWYDIQADQINLSLELRDFPEIVSSYAFPLEDLDRVAMVRTPFVIFERHSGEYQTVPNNYYSYDFHIWIPKRGMELPSCSR